MRKFELCLVMTILLVLSAVGCGGNLPKSSDQLLQPLVPVSEFAQKWVEEYGDGSKSIEHYNIVLLRELLSQEVKAGNAQIKELQRKDSELSKRILKLEEKDEVVWKPVN